MTWNTHYRIEWTDFLGLDWKIDIEEVDYAGSIIPMQATGEPLKIDFLTNSDNIIENPIKGSKADISVYSDSNFQWTDIFSSFDLEKRVSIYHSDTTLYWRGFITPGQYSEPYDGVSYPVTISASDGLGFLKNLPFDNSGVAYTGRQFESQIILNTLYKIQVLSFTEFVNIYEAGMATTATDSPMDQQKIDVDVFSGMSCYDVIEHLLVKYNAIIRQKLDGTIVIFRPYELVNPIVYGRIFTTATTKTGTSITPVQLINRIGYTSDIHDIEGGNMNIQGAVSKVTINQDYGNKESWIDNWNFTGSTFTETGLMTYSVTNWSKSNGCTIVPVRTAMPSETDGVILSCHNAYPNLDYYIYQSFGAYAITTTDICYIEFDYLLYNFSSSDETGEVIYVEVKKDGENQWLYAVDDNTCAWSGTSTRFAITTGAPVGSTGWVNFKRNIPGIPSDGTYTIKLIAVDNAYTQIFVGFKNVRFYSTSDKITIAFRKEAKWFNEIAYWGTRRMVPYVIFNNRNEVINKKHETINSVSGSAIGYTSILGDVVDSDVENVIEQFQGSLAIYVSSILSPSAAWSTRGGIENLLIDKLICNEIAFQYSRPKQMIRLPVDEKELSDNLPHIDLMGLYVDTLNQINGVNRLFVFSQGTFNVRERQWEIDLVEVIPPASPYVPPIELSEDIGALYNWYAVNGNIGSFIYYGYGLLYNWYAASKNGGSGTGSIAPSGWHLPTIAEFSALSTYLGGNAVSGGKLKEVGTAHWDTPNIGATNESGFNAIGSGNRGNTTGEFVLFKIEDYSWMIPDDPYTYGYISLRSNSTAIYFAYGTGTSFFTYGFPIRLIKDSTTLSNGESSTVTDYDGTVYQTICIGTQEWMASNLRVTHYNDGSPISEVTDNTAWAALTTGARCWYNNIP